MAELADAPDLGSGPQGCRFDSCYPHVNCIRLDDDIRAGAFVLYEVLDEYC